jgi:hypothetical protein
MRYQRAILIATIFIASVIGAHWLAGWLANSLSTRAGTAELPQGETVQIGDVWESPSQTIPVPFRNTTATAVNVANVDLSCRCMQITPTSFTIPPHGEVQVVATIDLTHRSFREVGKASRPPGELRSAFLRIGDHNAEDLSTDRPLGAGSRHDNRGPFRAGGKRRTREVPAVHLQDGKDLEVRVQLLGLASSER